MIWPRLMLISWMNGRELWLMDVLPSKHCSFKCRRIGGSYYKASYLDVDVFRVIQPASGHLRLFLNIAELSCKQFQYLCFSETINVAIHQTAISHVVEQRNKKCESVISPTEAAFHTFAAFQ